DAVVVVGCSGGIDSMVLLHVLRFAAGREAGTLVVAHFDHAMRPDSAADAAWVRGVCRAWGVAHREARAAAVPRGEGEARTARWAFLEAVAAEVGASGVATAHHADDQVETVLHHLIRGTGLRGLAGMAGRAGGRIRPLLPEPRAEIRRWAVAAGLAWRDDPTNARPVGPRNRIRHEVVPLLESLRPGSTRGVLRTARLVAREERALRQAEDHLLPGLVRRRGGGRITADLSALLGVPPELRARLIRRLAREVGGRLDAAGTRAAMEFSTGGPGAGECRVRSGVILRRSLGELEVEGPTRVEGPDERELDVPAPVGEGTGEVVAGGERWRVQWGPDDPDDPWSARFRSRPGEGGFRVRAWRPGDRIDLDGREVSVAGLWRDAGIPRHERRRRPVVEDGRGRLLWVPGSGRAGHAEHGSGPSYFIGIRHVDNP
ncbi:MAG: tRNA lysidine(34) synthetase TilS, partial [Longimicrobiales bacterium]